VFDNSEGKIGGAYASYNEVSLRRAVSRDGNVRIISSTARRCARKGHHPAVPRNGFWVRASYAIIEQGMISRVIEARPDDLRAFLEEAAGISRYKERRRENRKSHRPERARIWIASTICATRSTSRSAICSGKRPRAPPLSDAQGGRAEAAGGTAGIAPAEFGRGKAGVSRLGPCSTAKRPCRQCWRTFGKPRRRSSRSASINLPRPEALRETQERFLRRRVGRDAHRAEHRRNARELRQRQTSDLAQSQAQVSGPHGP